MLKVLNIKNLALIERLDLTLSSAKHGTGLTVLTGETGAGKSIVLQALNLLAGCRASASWIRSGEETASIEALFEVSPDKIELLNSIQDKGFETDGSFIVKRVFSSQGRSRYYINESLATARQAGELCENLLSIASQHDHQQLLTPRRHLDFIDTFGNLYEKRIAFSELFESWQELKTQHNKLLHHESEKEQRRDFLTFQCNEIRQANIKDNEDEGLAQAKKRLRSSDNLMKLGEQSYQLLSDSVVDSLAQVRKNLEQMASLDESASSLAEDIANSSYQLEDHMFRLRDYCESIPTDPALLDTIDERIDLLQGLKRKYGGPGNSLEEVLAFADKGEIELAEIDNMDQLLEKLTKELASKEKTILTDAAKLSSLRNKAAARLKAAMQQELKSLSFDEAVFSVEFHSASPDTEYDLEILSSTGWDRPEFMFSANPGEDEKPLVKIASGGELSRLMLALKCILAQGDQVQTVIFDEVDAGIGGKAAEAVALKIRELSEHHQVLCITHLPQIASHAESHFFVSKSVTDERTITSISPLSHEQRIHELSRMLAGDSITEQTIAYAKELIEKNRKPMRLF